MTNTDSTLHITLMDGMVRGLLTTATNTVSQAELIHRTSPVCTAALGRALMGTAMLAATLKEDKADVTVTIDGGGPIGRIVCVCDSGQHVRGTLDDPALDLPLRADGKLDVGAAVGRTGRMSVVKDLGLKSPYVGQTRLVSGEIAEDFAAYYAQSEQTPSLQALGVLVDKTGVLCAGGVLLQPLPGCPDDVISQLELRAPLFGDLSAQLMQQPMESLMEQWFRGLKPVIIGQTPLSYRCNCSRERMERALIALGKDELSRIIEDEIDGAEITCHFCLKQRRFSQQELKDLLTKATQA